MNRTAAGQELCNFVCQGIPWDKYADRMNRIEKISKHEIVDFANQYYKDNYAVVYKRTGEDKNVTKVEKPQITPVELNRQDQSEFLKNISEMQSEEIQPVFINYKTDLTESRIKAIFPVLQTKRRE
jgi:hypothetical protein